MFWILNRFTFLILSTHFSWSILQPSSSVHSLRKRWKPYLFFLISRNILITTFVFFTFFFFLWTKKVFIFQWIVSLTETKDGSAKTFYWHHHIHEERIQLCKQNLECYDFRDTDKTIYNFIYLSKDKHSIETCYLAENNYYSLKTAKVFKFLKINTVY